MASVVYACGKGFKKRDHIRKHWGRNVISLTPKQTPGNPYKKCSSQLSILRREEGWAICLQCDSLPRAVWCSMGSFWATVLGNFFFFWQRLLYCSKINLISIGQITHHHDSMSSGKSGGLSELGDRKDWWGSCLLVEVRTWCPGFTVHISEISICN